MNTDAWDYLLYTKFNDTLTYGVLIITTTKSSSWLNSNTSVSILYGIIRPSQNDKNMPRVSGRATVRLVRHFGIIFIPGFSLHGHKGFRTQSSVRSHAQKRKGSSWCFFFVCLGLVFVFVFFIIIICLLQANRADNDCPCGKKNRWFGEKKETEKPLKNRHHY